GRGGPGGVGYPEEEAPQGGPHQGGRAPAPGAERVTAHQAYAAEGPDSHGGRGPGADLRPAAPGRGAEPRDRAPGAGAAVRPPQALRPGARGPLQDQPA